MAFFDRLDALISRNHPPLLFFSSCMWAVPNRRTGTSKGTRERVDTQLTSSTIRWRPGEGGRKPQRSTFHRATRFFRQALSQTFPLLPPQAKRFHSRYQATKWKWTAPSKSSLERTLCFDSFSLTKAKEYLICLLWTPWTSDQLGYDACVHIHFSKVGSKPGWHYVTQSMRGRWVAFFDWRIVDFKEGDFVEIRTCVE